MVASPPPMPRLVATDLDGTLVGDGYTISRRSARTLARVAGAGIPVVLVTGRPVRWLDDVYEQLGGRYPAVCANGAVVYDPVVDDVRDLRPLPAPLLGELCRLLRAAIGDIMFAVELADGRGMRYEPAWPLYWDAYDKRAIPGSLDDLIAEPAAKLLARAGTRDPDVFAALVRSIVDGRAEVTHSSTTGLAELSAPGVTKATGLAAFAKALGVPASDVLAFGDMPNDLPMLRWAGRSVAVGNAHPEVRAVATEVTASNVDDGVAVYLERLLL